MNSKLLPLLSLLALSLSHVDATDEASRGVKEGGKCTTYKQEEGKCTPYYLCTISETTDESAGLIDIHSPIVCERSLDICCALKNIDNSVTAKPETEKEKV